MLNAGSKLLGATREILLAWAFGTTAVVDALRIGLTYTTYFANLFFGEAMTGVIVPLLVKPQEGDATRLSATSVKAGVTVGALLLTIPIGLLFVTLPHVFLAILTPDLETEQLHDATRFLRMFGLAIPVYSLSSIAVMVKQARGQYVPIGLRPVGQNLFLIGGITAAHLTHRPLLIPFSFLAYYALLLLLLDRGDLMRTLIVGLAATLNALKAVLAKWLPLATGLMVLRSYALVERYYGSWLPVGSIAALDYARTIAEVPLLVLAVPAGAVLLTRTSHRTGGGLSAAQRRKLAYLALMAVAWSVGLMLTADLLVRLVFQRGAFDADSVGATVSAVRGLAVGAWALVLNYLLAQYLMATGRPWLILVPAMVSLGVNIATATVLLPRLGILGLGLSTSAAAIAFAIGASLGVWWSGRYAGASQR